MLEFVIYSYLYILNKMDSCCVNINDARCCGDDPIPCCMRTQEAFNLMIYRLDRCYEYLDYQNEKLNLLMNEVRSLRKLIPLVPPVGERKA